MVELGVNIDHIATLREARRTIEPDPVSIASLAEIGGADQITVHLREDRRHIKDRDVELLRKTVKTKLNIECGADFDMIKKVVTYSPDQVTIVPEKREEITTEGGLNVIDREKEITEMVKFLKSQKIIVSLFMDPDKRNIDAALRTGPDAIELHTGRYSEAKGSQQIEELLKIEELALYIHKKKVKVHAGHGLNYQNVSKIASIEYIKELNIGHSIVSRSVFTGFENAVREMKNIIFKSRMEF